MIKCLVLSIKTTTAYCWKIPLENLKAIVIAVLFISYPYLVYEGINNGMSWLSPVVISGLFIHRALVSKQINTTIVNASLAILLVLGAIYVQTFTAKILPVLVQIMLMLFFGRTLLADKGPPFIESVVRLQFPD